MTRLDAAPAPARRITPELLRADVPVMKHGRTAAEALEPPARIEFVADSTRTVFVPLGRRPADLEIKDGTPAVYSHVAGDLLDGVVLHVDGTFSGAVKREHEVQCEIGATIGDGWTGSMTLTFAAAPISELQSARAAGKAAEERLVAECRSFVESLVQAEMRRRMGWNSRIEREDLVQEANYGLLRGLLAWDPTAAGASATSYLGMWITSEMRRNTEALDHDFVVPFDAADRYRKVRAIRARLESQGQDSSDEAVARASTDDWTVIGVPRGFVQQQGRKTGGGGKSRGGSVALRPEQVAEERRLAGRVGATLVRYDAVEEGEEERSPHLERAVPIDGSVSMTVDPAALATENASKLALARLLHETFENLGLPDLQRDVVARRFGLPPHEGEDSARSISRQIGVPRDLVGRILEAFQEEMALKGGAFHASTARVPDDSLDDLGLGWVRVALGPYKGPDPKHRPPAVLTDPIQSSAKVPPPPEPPVSDGVLAQFMCEFHKRAFTGLYADEETVPTHRDCPSCSKPSPLLRTVRA